VSSQPNSADSRSEAAPFPAYFSSFGYLTRVQLLLLMEAFPAATLPLWWGALQDERGYTLVDFAVVQTAGAVGMLIVGLVLAPLIVKIDRRLAIAVLAFIFAASLFGIIALPAITAVIICWGFVSFATAGIESIGLAYLGYSSQAQRNNGIYVTIQTVTYGIAPLAFPFILGATEVSFVLAAFAVIVLAILPMAIRLPAHLPELQAEVASDDPEPRRSGRFWAASIGAIIAYGLFSWYTITLFNYSEQLGRLHELDMASVGMALGLAGFLGIPGSLIAAYGGQRLGTLIPVIAGGVLFAAAAIVLTLPGTQFFTFAAALTLTSFCWNLMMPYLLSIFASIDPQGRVLAASYPVRGATSILLSAATAALLTGHGADAVAWLCAICVVLSVLAYAVAWGAVHKTKQD
jgi:predicted MFS family arabinose efflux permease